MNNPDDRQWLLSDGLGNYASGPVSVAPTQYYHGLLVGPEGALLARLEESLAAGASSAGPVGNLLLTQFDYEPIPTWRYRVGGGELLKQICCPPGHHATVIGYRWQGDRPVVLSVRLFASGPHWLQSVDDRGVFSIEGGPGPSWYWRCHPYRYVEYRFEGHPNDKDHFALGVAQVSLQPKDWVSFTFTTEPDSRTLDIRDLSSRHKDDLYRSLNRARFPSSPVSRALLRAAEQMVIEGEDHSTIVEGYPPGPVEHEAVAALGGLLLSTGRFDVARSVLAGHDGKVRTPEAPLLWVDALYTYWQYTEDRKFLTGQYPRVAQVISTYCESSHGVTLDPDGLLSLEAPAQGEAVLPRKPLVLNALWYNALQIAAELALAAGEEAAPYIALATNAHAGLQHWDDAGDLSQLHPESQVAAVGLPFNAFSPEKTAQILNAVEQELAPYGLRTLDQEASPWLLVAFCRAYWRHNPGEAALEKLRVWLSPLLSYVLTHGTLPQSFEAEPPYRAHGQIAAARSIAAVTGLYGELVEAGVSFEAIEADPR